MLTHRFSTVFCVQAAFGAALLSGCVVLSNPTGSGGSAAGGGGGGGSSVSSSKSTSTSSSSGSDGGMCVGVAGIGAVADCDKLKISPKMGTPGNCGMTKMDPAYGYSLCTRGYTIFTNGAADYLDACIAGIAIQDACNVTPAQDCMTKMFDATCPDAAIAASCADIGKQCGTDPFDVTKCTGDLKPFSNAGLTELEDCLNKAIPVDGCQKAYDNCYSDSLTF